jgi:hypothetical protein
MDQARGIRIAIAAAVLTAVAAAGAFARGDPPSLGRTAPAAAHDFAVTSSLDGKAVLPHTIAWLGTPSLPAAKVAEVDFLIDGRQAWIEHAAPYSFSDDGGYLVTSWLRPGIHRFTVRARTSDGRTAVDTVKARVAPAKDPPTALAGRWERTLATSVPAPGGQGAGAPAGRWVLVFDRKWVQDRAPGRWDPVKSATTGAGAVVDNEWVPGARRFELGGGVTTRLTTDADAEGGWWCDPAGPSASYAWSVHGDTLTLTGSDPCRERGAVYVGTWTRIR